MNKILKIDRRLNEIVDEIGDLALRRMRMGQNQEPPIPYKKKENLLQQIRKILGLRSNKISRDS